MDLLLSFVLKGIRMEGRIRNRLNKVKLFDKKQKQDRILQITHIIEVHVRGMEINLDIGLSLGTMLMNRQEEANAGTTEMNHQEAVGADTTVKNL